MTSMSNAQVALMAAVALKRNENIYVGDERVTKSANHFLDWLNRQSPDYEGNNM